MLHFGLACNLLAATGKEPQVLKGYGRITYPGPLPGGVVPACDGRLVPCDPKFEVRLGFDDFHAFAWMATQIEYPEDPVPRPLLETVETFATIGQFYDAIAETFQDNNSRIRYDTAKQRNGPLGLYLIDNLAKAIAAIQLIQQQGEGGHNNPFSGPNQLSHFYAFGELYYLRKYRFNAATETGDWTGSPIYIPADGVYPMTPVPPGGYASPLPEVVEFDRTFTQLLTWLESAWGAGGAADLDAAIRIMPALTAQATDLLKKQVPRTDAPGIYGPQFRIDTSS